MDKYLPLATRLRPEKLEDFVGHDKIISPASFLYQAIKSDRVPSMIFWGPPGSGKTTLALIIAKETKGDFLKLSATSSGLKDLRLIIDRASDNQRLMIKTFLFIDEIHRWNKSQQDALLPYVENGLVILLGATTENPSFAINSALLSRVKVVVLKALADTDVSQIIKRALGVLKIKLKSTLIDLMAHYANGDARQALNILESCLQKDKNITRELIEEIISQPVLLYDKAGEEHYNLISALHKSMRGGDAAAAVYWLARMIEGGEDPLYVARRLIRFASEDIGLANNSALMLATSAYEACKNIGVPECNVNLAQTVIYLAKSKKSISAYQTYLAAQAAIAEKGNLPVPLHLRNAPTNLMKKIGYGQNYKYTPLAEDKNQEYLPPELKNSPWVKDINSKNSDLK